MFHVKQGVPCWEGKRKIEIRDRTLQIPLTVRNLTWQYSSTESDGRHNLRRPSPFKFGTPYIGEDQDAFMVDLHILEFIAKDLTALVGNTCYTGYAQFSQALWTTTCTTSCLHKHYATDEQCLVRVNDACRVLSHFGGAKTPFINEPHLAEHGRIFICLTAGNRAARWRALIAILSYQDQARAKMGQSSFTLLRREDCCCACAVEQVSAKKGKWFLVL